MPLEKALYAHLLATRLELSVSNSEDVKILKYFLFITIKTISCKNLSFLIGIGGYRFKSYYSEKIDFKKFLNPLIYINSVDFRNPLNTSFFRRSTTVMSYWC